jgi:hypothetical protein
MYLKKVKFCQWIVFAGVSFTIFGLGCQGDSGESATKVYVTKGDTVLTKETTTVNDTSYHLSDFTPELRQYLVARLRDSRQLLSVYSGKQMDESYDPNTLDEVFQRWREKKGQKEKPEFVVEALGFALGQYFVDSLHMEWQVWTDAHGQDLAVINKKYVIFAFPLSSSEKAYTENKIGSFEGIRVILSKELEEAERSGKVKER